MALMDQAGNKNISPLQAENLQVIAVRIRLTGSLVRPAPNAAGAIDHCYRQSKAF